MSRKHAQLLALALAGEELPRFRYYSEGRNYDQLRAEQKAYILRRDGERCVYCHDEAAKLHVDHIIPRVCGGPNEDWNLAAACPRCNLSKHATHYNRDVLREKLLIEDVDFSAAMAA